MRPVVLAAVVVALACGKSSVEMQDAPIDLVALEDGGALVISGRTISAVDGAARARWQHAVAGSLVPDETLVGESQVFARYVGHDGFAHGIALHLDGRVAWDVVLATTPASRQEMSLSYRPVVVGAVVVWMLRDGDPTLVAVDTRGGSVAWRATADAQASAVAVGTQLLERVPGKPATWRDPRNGAPQPGPPSLHGCFDGITYLTVDGHRLTSHQGPNVRSDLELPRLLVDDESVLLVGCGVFGEQTVLVVKHAGRDAHLHLVLVLAADGRLVRSIELPAAAVDADALGIELPRFVLLRADTRYVMIDLEAGRVAWQQPEGRPLGGTIVRSATRWYATDGYGALAGFDGRTGQLVRALTVAPPEPGTASGSLLVELEPTHFRRGVGWLLARTRRPLSRPDVLLLDEATLAPRVQQGTWGVIDETVSVAETLGIAPR